MGIHKGTKLTDSPKEITVRARIDTETAEKLDYLVEKKSATKSDIIRTGIEMQHEKELSGK